MTHSLILAGLSLLTREFAVAHPSKPTKGFLRAEVGKLVDLVEGLPDEDAAGPPAAAAQPVDHRATMVVGVDDPGQSGAADADGQLPAGPTISSASLSDTKASSAAS